MDQSPTLAPVKAEIRVAVPPTRAFDIFTARMGRWWNPAYSIGGSRQADVVIEPRASGRWYERGEDGSESPWGRVLVWDPPSRLVLAWQINADWKFDPGFATELEIRFQPEGGDATRVLLEHRHLERFGEKAELARASFASEGGWPGLLQRFAERIAA
jgi:uncharacterized protein YndB with AHSA1/START domain